MLNIISLLGFDEDHALRAQMNVASDSAVVANSLILTFNPNL
jgi:hypothetical protein